MQTRDPQVEASWLTGWSWIGFVATALGIAAVMIADRMLPADWQGWVRAMTQFSIGVVVFAASGVGLTALSRAVVERRTHR